MAQKRNPPQIIYSTSIQGKCTRHLNLCYYFVTDKIKKGEV